MYCYTLKQAHDPESHSMKAYVYGASGAAIADVPKPSPKGAQVMVKVHACGMNRADLGMIKGHVHGAAGGVGTVLGMEWAGEVVELGPDAKGSRSVTASWAPVPAVTPNTPSPIMAACFPFPHRWITNRQRR
jgi:NADPH:quinone reductase-like Zn-dependent oxidoreductase